MRRIDSTRLGALATDLESPWTVSELASRHGVPERTIYRWLQALVTRKVIVAKLRRLDGKMAWQRLAPGQS